MGKGVGRVMKEAFSNWLRRDLKRWLGDLARNLASLIMFFLISVAVCAGLLYILKALWFTYTATPTGEHFIEYFGSRADAIERVLSHRLLSLSLYVNLTAVRTCLVAGAIGRLFFLVRYLYEYRGFWVRMLFWGLPCAVFTAYVIGVSYDLDWIPALLLSAISILVLLGPCIRLVSGLFPEIKALWRSISSFIKKEEKATSTPPTED